jgi:uncharacterized protein with GYD domain
MATYIVLASFTDQGIRKVKDSPKRADAFKEMAKKCGATVKDVFWTLGDYDIVIVLEAPDDISITALGLSSGALGNIRTKTLRAFTQADMFSFLPTTRILLRGKKKPRATRGLGLGDSKHDAA